jgi:hypothetical protein
MRELAVLSTSHVEVLSHTLITMEVGQRAERSGGEMSLRDLHPARGSNGAVTERIPSVQAISQIDPDPLKR